MRSTRARSVRSISAPARVELRSCWRGAIRRRRWSASTSPRTCSPRPAKLTPPELAGRVRFERADAERLSYPDGSFDLVSLANMIPFFEELARVTAPGGAVVFSFSAGTETPIYVPPDVLRGRAGEARFRGICGLCRRQRNGVVCAQTRGGVGFSLRGRSRHGDTGPDVLFCAATWLHCGRGEVAQLVEHTAENRGVAGSIPALAT